MSGEVLVALIVNGDTTFYRYPNLELADDEIAELEELACSDECPVNVSVSAYIVQPAHEQERVGPLVDELAWGAALGNRLEAIGYEREAGRWYLRSDDGQEAAGDMTLPEAIQHARDIGAWEE